MTKSSKGLFSKALAVATALPLAFAIAAPATAETFETQFENATFQLASVEDTSIGKVRLAPLHTNTTRTDAHGEIFAASISKEATSEDTPAPHSVTIVHDGEGLVGPSTLRIFWTSQNN